MQKADSKDKKCIKKCGNEAALMEERIIIVKNNSLEMDSEEIESDTGQVEADILISDDVRIQSDSVVSDIVGIELGLLATLADPETRRRIMDENCDLSNIEMPTVGDTTDEEDDDNMSSCSDSPDSKEWITLRPDDENLDSSKIAALSSAFSSYISSPKHAKNKKNTVHDITDPNTGQFLLPLVTERLLGQDVNPNVETNSSVMEMLQAEAEKLQKDDEQMSELAWRILGEYHALENNGDGDVSLEDEEQRQQVMQIISKCMNEDDTLLIFRELDKELQSRTDENAESHISEIFTKLLQNDTVTNCLNTFESDKLKKFSDTHLVKKVLHGINGDNSATCTNMMECDDLSPSSENWESAVTGQSKDSKQSEGVGSTSTKFLENSPLRSTLEQYMMMQIASREAEAEENQRLLRELGDTTNSKNFLTSIMSGDTLNLCNRSTPGSEEPPQRIFDCDSINTSSRFLELDDDTDDNNPERPLCPGGCGNLRHCSRYRVNGANNSSSKSISSSSDYLDAEGDQDMLSDSPETDQIHPEGDDVGLDKGKQDESEDAVISRRVDIQSGWWELRALLIALWHAADVGGLACKNVAVATVPPCHCCRCSHPVVRQLPLFWELLSSENSCPCRHANMDHPNQSTERCRQCLVHRVEGLMKLFWGNKEDVAVPKVCCCQERRSNRSPNRSVVRLYFKDRSIPPSDFDLSMTEFSHHDLEVSEEDSKFLEECHLRYLEDEEDIPCGDEDVVPLCARCRCKCGRAKFYCPKMRDRAIKQNFDNFTRLAPQLLILRLDALCTALCAWHGAHLSRMLAIGAVMTFLKELWRRAAAMRTGGIALSGILGPTRRRLATVCGRLLAPHIYLNVVYRMWAGRAAATRVVHLSMLQLLGKAPEGTVEALNSFASLLSMMNEAETLSGDVTTFLGNYMHCEQDASLVTLLSVFIMSLQAYLHNARYLGLLGDDPCELANNPDCESSIVARRLSECLPTDPEELDEFKRIVQAMLLYHSSGGTVNQPSVTRHQGERKKQRGKRSLETNTFESLAHYPNSPFADCNILSKGFPMKENGEPKGHVSDSKVSISDTSLKVNGDRLLHSAAVIKRRQELEKEFVEREKSRIINSIVSSFSSGNYTTDDTLSSALFQASKTSLDAAKRLRPVKRKFKSTDACDDTNILSGNVIPQTSDANGTGARAKNGSLKPVTKTSRISKSSKGRLVKNIRRASIGHMNEIVRKDCAPVTKTSATCCKASVTKRGRSSSLYSETRKYLESAIKDHLYPINIVQVSGSDNLLKWYSLPDMGSKDSDSDASVNSTVDAFCSLKIGDLHEPNAHIMHTKELNSNLKGLTSKFIPELFIPPPSSVDPSLDIQFKKDFDIYLKNVNCRIANDEMFNEDVLDKLRKPVFNDDTPEQKYLHMEMCEFLEKMELLRLKDHEPQNKHLDNDDDDSNVPSPPLEFSPTAEKVVNFDINEKRIILSLNQNVCSSQMSDENVLTENNSEIVNKSVVNEGSVDAVTKIENDLSLDDIKLAETLPFLELLENTTKKDRDSVDTGETKKEKCGEDKASVEADEKEKKRLETLRKVEEINKSTADMKYLNSIIREHGIDPLKRILDPFNYVKNVNTKHLWNMSDDLSCLTPETIKQLKEVRYSRLKKQTCGKRKNVKRPCECAPGSNKPYPDKTPSQPILMEDPTKEEIMIEMLGHRHKKKGFRNAKEFQAKLLTASLQLVMRKVLQVLMPCDEDIELENLKKSGNFGSPYDVKVGNEIDGCNIDDYWDEIKAQFSSWRACTLEQYWNLPEHYKNPDVGKKNEENASKPSDIEHPDTQALLNALDEQKKKTVKKSVTSKIITLDPIKAKTFVSPVEHSLVVEKLQAVNKDYVDKLIKQNLSGGDWINELQTLERKLKSASKNKLNTSSSSSGSRAADETREAELLAGRGLSKLINQFSKKTKDVKQDLNAKQTKAASSADASKTDKSKSSPTVSNQLSKAAVADANGKQKDDSKVLELQQAKLETGMKSLEIDKKFSDSFANVGQDKLKTAMVSGKARPAMTTPAGETNNVASDKNATCKIALQHDQTVESRGAAAKNPSACCHGCDHGNGKEHDEKKPNKDITTCSMASVEPKSIGNHTGVTEEETSKNKDQSVVSQSQQVTGKTGNKAASNSSKPTCIHAPSNGACKGGEHHTRHGHQHTCANANQREADVNPNSIDNCPIRCNQLAGSPRGTNNTESSNPSNGASGANSDQSCACCYCTVFGHAPPATTQVSKNFNETRERLRSILNRKKQSRRPGSTSSQSGGDADNSDGKAVKAEESPPLIPVGPTNKPDPIPSNSVPKQKTGQAITSVIQSDSTRSNAALPKQTAPIKTTQAVSTKPSPCQTSQQNIKSPDDSTTQKPNLPLKFKIKQGDGQMAMQDIIKKEGENLIKEVWKNTMVEDPKNSATKKSSDLIKVAKEPSKNSKDSANEAIKNCSIVDLNKIVDKKLPLPAKREKTEGASQKQLDAVSINNSREVEEQNMKNAKQQNLATAGNESKGIQTDKPKNAPYRSTIIQKTGPQPLQPQRQVKKAVETNKPKTAMPVCPQDQCNPASSTSSRDCSISSTSTVYLGCSNDPRDLDTLMEFIEGPGCVMDKIKKKAKKARQKAKKVIEKLELKLSRFELKAAQLRAKSDKLDKLLVAAVGKKKKPSKKGKKKGDKNENEVEDERVVALRKEARECRERVAQAQKELEDGRRMLNRVAKALLLIGSTEDVSQLPEVIAAQQQVSLMSSLDDNEDDIDNDTSLSPELQELEKIVAMKQSQQQQQNSQQKLQPAVETSRSSSLDQLFVNSLQKQNAVAGKPPSQCMVTIKRVIMPESGEPSVTITPKGSDKPIYTFQSHAGSLSHQVQQQHFQQPLGGQYNQSSDLDPNGGFAAKKKGQGLSWESALAQINTLSQGKKKNRPNKMEDVEKSHHQQQVQEQKVGGNQHQAHSKNNKAIPSSVNSSQHASRSASTVSELSSVDADKNMTKKQRKQLTKKLQQEQEEREQMKLMQEKLSAQKENNKKAKGAKHVAHEEVEDDPEKIVLSMRQLKTAVERALEAMDSDMGGQKLQGKGKLKANAKEFIEKVVSKVEETKKATAAQSAAAGKRVDKVVDISEVVLGSFSGKMASAAKKQQQPAQKTNQQNAKSADNQKLQNTKDNSQQSQQQPNNNNKKKQKQKEAVANGNTGEGPKVISSKGAIPTTAKKSNANAKKTSMPPTQSTTSVHHRSTPMDYQQGRGHVLLSNPNAPGVGHTGYSYGQQHQPNPNHKELNANYMNKMNLNSDITIQLADQDESNSCGNGGIDTKPGGPVSCSIMEQLRNGVQVPDLKLPPGITLTWVDPNKKQPDPTPKAAIPVVKLSSVAPEYRPTPPVVNPPPLIMVDTKSIPHNKDPKAQVAQSAQITNQQQQDNKSKSKKSKKKTKKPPPNLIQQVETSTHSHQRVDEPKMVTLRNPMFHPTLPSVSLSSVQSGKRVSENIRIPDPIPMPPNACQATITPTSNGMFTIRNPLMSMVHQQNMMAMKDAAVPPSNAPVVLMSNSGSTMTQDMNQMKDHHSVNVDLAGRVADLGLKNNCNPPMANQQISPPHRHHQNKEESTKIVNPNSDFLAQNLSFTPNKDSRGYSLFKSEENDSASPIIAQRTPETNVCPSPIGSKTNRTPPAPMNAIRQLDFNNTQHPVGCIPNSGWQDCPLPVNMQSRKSDDMSSDSGVDVAPPGFYTPFGQADSEKLFGSLLFQNSTRDEHLQQTMWSTGNAHEEHLLRNLTQLNRMDLLSNSAADMGLMANSDIKINPNANGGRGQRWGNGSYTNTNTPSDYIGSNNGAGGPVPPLYQQPPSSNYDQQSFPGTINQSTFNNSQIHSSHSSSSSGLMTGSVVSSGTNSVYDSVSNSSSNSPADATNPELSTNTPDIASLQQTSPESRTFGDYSSYMPVMQQQSNSNYNAFGRVTDSPGTAERMADLLTANCDRLNDLSWYPIGSQSRDMSDTFNQMRISEEQNFMSQQARLSNVDLAYYNAQRSSAVNTFSPSGSSSNGTQVFRQANSEPLLHNDLSNKYGPYGAIGQGKQQQINIPAEEGQTTKNLGAIGSHRSGVAANGMRQDEYFSGWRY